MEITKEMFVELDVMIKQNQKEGYAVISDVLSPGGASKRKVMMGNDGVYWVAYQFIYPSFGSRDKVNSVTLTSHDLELMLNWQGNQS